MLDKISLQLSSADKARKAQVFRDLKARYENYRDPWGFNLKTIKKALSVVLPIYRNYFKVRVFGIENIKDEPYMLVSNHTGQVPIDGALITMAMAFEVEKPRVVHSMVERFMAGLPFIGDFSAQAGSILGDRANCKWLLKQGESILVFPEGVRGINKSTKNFYKLQKFSSGFYRIALSSGVKILPISVVGAEDMFPIVFQAKSLGKKFGLPSFPIPLNFIPLPSPIDIYIGEPIEVQADLTSESQETELRPAISEIENVIEKNIKLGLKNRRNFLDKYRIPIQDFMRKF